MPTLRRKKILTIIPTTPFHFDGTFNKPSHFPDKLSDWQPGKYWQTIRLGRKLFGLKIENKGSIVEPKLEITVFSDKKNTAEELEIIKQEITWRFDLNADLKEFNQLAKKDRRFYPVFKKWRGMRTSSSDSLYELLIIAVLLQNATVRRTVQMMNALLDKFGTKVRFDNKELFAIWQPQDLKNVREQELRHLKIGYRAKFIKRLSQDFAQKRIDEVKLRQMNKEAVAKELMNLYGVGPETARILLFEVFHYYDTFDHIAPWQQKIYSRLFYNQPLVSIKKIQTDIKRQYGKYAMLAVHYIWEDIFWRRKNERIAWLEKEIRL